MRNHKGSTGSGLLPIIWFHGTADCSRDLYLRYSAFFGSCPFVFTEPQQSLRSRTIAVLPVWHEAVQGLRGVLRYGTAEALSGGSHQNQNDYILLPINISELDLRLRRIHALKAPLQNTQLPLEPNSTEAAVFQLLLKNKDRVVEKAILQQLTGVYQRSRSIDMCISRLRNKIRRTQLQLEIKSVRGVGYLLVDNL